MVLPGQKDPTSTADPVCRMPVNYDTVPARLPFKDANYACCSLDCARAFAQHPDRYAAL